MFRKASWALTDLNQLRAGADDVHLAWRALGGLDDPTVVLATSGTPDVANVLRPDELPVGAFEAPHVM